MCHMSHIIHQSRTVSNTLDFKWYVSSPFTNSLMNTWHVVTREFVIGSPRYHLGLKRAREQFVVL